jgi:hypothetical protein
LQPHLRGSAQQAIRRKPTISSALGTTNWRHSGVTDGYFGFRFFNTTTGAVNYGYAHLVANGITGYPITLLNYAYNKNGDPITIP